MNNTFTYKRLLDADNYLAFGPSNEPKNQVIVCQFFNKKDQLYGGRQYHMQRIIECTNAMVGIDKPIQYINDLQSHNTSMSEALECIEFFLIHNSLIPASEKTIILQIINSTNHGK